MAKSNILIVEDEQVLANALRLKLTEDGYAASVALNGKEALAALENQSFDLILLDILMPTMDGWDVLKHLQGKSMKILVLSNLSQEEDIRRARSLGASDFLVKSETSLLDVIKRTEEMLEQ